MNDQVVEIRKSYLDEAGGSNMNYHLEKKGSYDYVGEDSSLIGESNMFKDYLLSMLE